MAREAKHACYFLCRPAAAAAVKIHWHNYRRNMLRSSCIGYRHDYKVWRTDNYRGTVGTCDRHL